MGDAQPPQCIVWLDYATSRTATATTQSLMAALARDGYVAHRETIILGGAAAYPHSDAAWARLAPVLGAPCASREASSGKRHDDGAGARSGAPRPPPLRLAVQVVADTSAKGFWATWLPSVRKLRAQLGSCCRVLLTTRVREPLSHYLSTYLWATAGKPNLGTQFARPRAVTRGRMSYAQLPQPSFEAWSIANLQTRVLLHGGASRLLTDEQSGRLAAGSGSGDGPAAVSRAGLAVLLDALDRDFDLVTPLDAFESAVLAVADALHIPRNASALRYERISPRAKMFGGGVVGEVRTRALAATCPNMTACEAHVRRIAPFDAELYAAARRRLPSGARRETSFPFEHRRPLASVLISSTPLEPEPGPAPSLELWPSTLGQPSMLGQPSRPPPHSAAGGVGAGAATGGGEVGGSTRRSRRSAPLWRIHTAGSSLAARDGESSAAGGNAGGHLVNGSTVEGTSSDIDDHLAPANALIRHRLGCDWAWGRALSLGAARGALPGGAGGGVDHSERLAGARVRGGGHGAGHGSARGAAVALRARHNASGRWLEAAIAQFTGACAAGGTGSVSIDGSVDVSDDAPQAEHSRRARLQMPPISTVHGCALPIDVSRYREPTDDACAEVRVVFYFAPPPPPGRPRRVVRLPSLAPSPCNVAMVDAHTQFVTSNSLPTTGAESAATSATAETAVHVTAGASRPLAPPGVPMAAEVAGPWRLRRLEHWPFPNDAPRTAHYLKVLAPLLFPRAMTVLAGDVKCQGASNGFPCALMRPAQAAGGDSGGSGGGGGNSDGGGGGVGAVRLRGGDDAGGVVDLRVAKNRWYKSRSIEGEFVSTWKHMRLRKMGASVFREINAQLAAYEREGYDLDPIYRMPDTFCMGWAATPAAYEFSCSLAHEVATRSMREQLSFDHARPTQLNLTWWPMNVLRQHGSERCVDSSVGAAEGGKSGGEGGGKGGGGSNGEGKDEGVASPTARRRVRSERTNVVPARHAPQTPPLAMVAVGGDVRGPARVGQKAAARAGAPAAAGHLAAPSTRHALCVTGLQRSFVEHGPRSHAHVLGLLQATAPHVTIRKFGVKPLNDSWSAVHRLLGDFDRIEQQAPCRPHGAALPAFFTCTRGRVVHRLDSCTASFVQMMCDLSHAEAMVSAYERDGGSEVHGGAFDFVTWMRLDVAWEMALAPPLPLLDALTAADDANRRGGSDGYGMPTADAGLESSISVGGSGGSGVGGVGATVGHPNVKHLAASAVWVPMMNSQRAGINDKFAFGGRRAMAAYLTRLRFVDLNYSAVPRSGQNEAARWTCRDGEGGQQVCRPRRFADISHQCTKKAGCMLSLSSERFLAFSLYRSNLTVVRMKGWAFCKFGDTTNAWPGCTARLRAGTPCAALSCPSWMAGGCQCLNKTCTTRSWYCTNTSSTATSPSIADASAANR